MNALASQSTVPFACSSNGAIRPLARISQVANHFQIHPNTLRNAVARGALRCYTLDSGHRRFQLDEVERWLGRGHHEQEKGGEGVSTSQPVKIAKVIRVSSYAQSVKQGNSETSSRNA